MIRPERIYQYPFFMGAIFISFVLPQAIALIKNPDPVTSEALERVLIMSCLCAAMCWIGYQLPANISLIKKLDILLHPTKLLYGGIAFIVSGYFFSFLISQLPEATTKNSQWTGIVTIYAFFAGLIYPGLTVALLSTIERPTLTKILITILAAWIPIQTIILFGRREPTATFLLTIGLCLYYSRRYVPPRWIALVVLVAALVIIPLTGTYRGIATTGKWNQLLELRPGENLKTFVEEGKILELRNAALLMDATVKTGNYAYGTDYWNSFVFRFIPAQLIGSELKNFLYIKLPKFDLGTIYSYKIPTGSTITGMGDAFIQFDYLGSIFFGLLAYFFKNLWISAIYTNSKVSQLFYVSLVSPAMIAITHGTVRFTSDVFFYSIFLGALVLYSRIKPY